MVRRTVSDYLRDAPDSAAKASGPAPASAPTLPLSGAALPPDLLAAELRDLGETLDVLATVVASVSDRVDGQTDALGRLAKAAAETRQAAFAARSQTDPGKLAADVQGAIDKALLPRLHDLSDAVQRMNRAGAERDSLGKMEGRALDLARDLRLARDRAALWRDRLPGIALATLVLALALVLLAPRFAADHDATCWLMGGDWRDYRAWGDGTSCRFDRPTPPS